MCNSEYVYCLCIEYEAPTVLSYAYYACYCRIDSTLSSTRSPAKLPVLIQIPTGRALNQHRIHQRDQRLRLLSFTNMPELASATDDDSPSPRASIIPHACLSRR